MKLLVFSMRLLASLFLLFTALAAQAQAPAWQLAVATTQASGSRSQVQATTMDANGNVYLVGSFSGTVSFGSISLTSIGIGSAFVAKWSSATNTIVWAQQAGGILSDGANAIAVHGTNVYIVGTFLSPTITLGTNTLTNFNTGSFDVFVAKLTDAGLSASFTWAQKIGGSFYDYGRAIAVSGNNVYLVGEFASASAVLGGITLVKSNGADYDMYVTKLVDAGNTSSFVWAQQNPNVSATGIATIGTAVYVAGSFYSPTATFGTQTLINSGQGDIYVAKLVDAGSTSNYIWAQKAGGSEAEQVNAVAVNATNVYLSGSFKSASLSFGSTSISNAGSTFYNDAFVAKLTDAGSTADFVWAQRAGGTGDDAATAIALNGTNVYVTGRFASATATFGNSTLANTGNSTYDIFVARLTDSGTSAGFTWAQRAGGLGDDYGTAVSTNNGQQVHVAGAVAPAANFGTLVISSPLGGTVAFLASLTEGVLATRNSSQLANLTLYPNPAHTKTTIQVPTIPPGAAQIVLTITDALGRAVRIHKATLPATSLRHELDLAGVAPGLYILRMDVGAATTTRQLIVE